MYQVFAEKRAATSRRSSAMERRDHFKNAASQKSHTSKENQKAMGI